MKSAKEKERELILKLSREEKTCREIASILDISKSKVSFWVIRYKKTGEVKDKLKSGRPTILTKDKLSELSSLIKAGLLNQKNKAGISSKEVLHLIENKINRRYTLRHVQRLLRKMGFSLVTPRVSHIRKDEKAQKKFKRQFKKNFKRRIWTIQS